MIAKSITEVVVYDATCTSGGGIYVSYFVNDMSVIHGGTGRAGWTYAPGWSDGDREEINADWVPRRTGPELTVYTRRKPAAEEQDAIAESWERYDQNERARRADPFYKLMDSWFIITWWVACGLGFTTAVYGWWTQ